MEYHRSNNGKWQQITNKNNGYMNNCTLDLDSPQNKITCPRCGYFGGFVYGNTYECAVCGHCWEVKVKRDK
jgi:hypothetical protein